jgi:hypothetical protein
MDLAATLRLELAIDPTQDISILDLVLEFGDNDSLKSFNSRLLGSRDTDGRTSCLQESDIDALLYQIKRRPLSELLRIALAERVGYTWDIYQKRLVQISNSPVGELALWIETLLKRVDILERSLKSVNDCWTNLNTELASVAAFNEEDLLQK